MRNAECGMRNAECGMRNAECGKDAKQSSRIFEAVPLFICHCRICAIPHSLFRIPHSLFPTSCDNVNENSGLYLLEGTIKYVFSIP
jgi:hypothetical protein